MNEWLNPDKIIELAQHYKALGPFLGLLLPFIESFLPFLTTLCICFCECRCLWTLVRFPSVMGGNCRWLLCSISYLRKYGRNRVSSISYKKCTYPKVD